MQVGGGEVAAEEKPSLPSRLYTAGRGPTWRDWLPRLVWGCGALLESVLPSEVCSEIWNCFLGRYPQPNPVFLLTLF